MSEEQVVYLVAAAAPPVFDLPELISLVRSDGWSPCPILTPTAASWLDIATLEEAAGRPVRSRLRRPGEQDPFPPANAVLAAPLTFNTLNKWAQGMNDTTALGVLNELLGEGVPIVAAPCVKPVLQSHPAYANNLQRLRDHGVTFLDEAKTVVRTPEGKATFDWPVLIEALLVQ